MWCGQFNLGCFTDVDVTIGPPVNQPWWIWGNKNMLLRPKTRQTTTTPCAYILGCSVWTYQPLMMTSWYGNGFHLEMHYGDVIMTTVASQILSLTIVYWIIYSDADRRKYQSSESLAFVWGIHRWPVNSPHKGPVRGKSFHLMTSSC